MEMWVITDENGAESGCVLLDVPVKMRLYFQDVEGKIHSHPVQGPNNLTGDDSFVPIEELRNF